MLTTMSRTCNASAVDRGSSSGGGGWKNEPSYRSSDSVESSSAEDSDNSSTNSSMNGRQNSNSHLQPEIGCITTNRVSAVIRPERKMPPIDPLQFVKIQKNELSKKAVEQIKLAEEVKITKEKIKEVEEEWQNNLMDWKSKRKLTKNNSEDEVLPRNPNRKTKTFSEILNEKAKSGARIGYNLHKYIDPDLEEELDSIQTQTTKDLNTSTCYANRDSNNATQPNMENNNTEQSKTNLDRFLAANDEQQQKISRNGLGEVVIFNTSLLKEFSVKSSDDNNCDNQKSEDQPSKMVPVETLNNQNESPFQRVHVPITDWKSSHSPPNQTSEETHKNFSIDDDSNQPQNSSFEIDEEEELLDEELEKLRLDQERSFKAKLRAFETLAQKEEEEARRAVEANRKRQQNRQVKLATERSKSMSNINSSSSQNQQANHKQTSTTSASSSNLQQNKSSKPKSTKIEDSYYQLINQKNNPSTSVIYNFKDKPQSNASPSLHPMEKPQSINHPQSQKSAIKSQPVIDNESVTKSDNACPVPHLPNTTNTTNNIYENVPNLSVTNHHQHLQQKLKTGIESCEAPVSDSDAIRNASQKLLLQQQQLYQNQPPISTPMSPPIKHQYPINVDPYPNYNMGYPPDLEMANRGYRSQIPDSDVGLPPIQITKTIQSIPSDVSIEHPVYQNHSQVMATHPQNFHQYDNYHHHHPEAMMIPRREELVGSQFPRPVSLSEPIFHPSHQPTPYDMMNSTYINSQYLYYPKPFTGVPPPNPNGIQKPIPKQQLQPTRIPSVQNNPNRYGANGYNPNHWVIQEATQRMQQAQQQSLANMPPTQTVQNKNQFLSVSGKKKCSNCGDELGKGCAAMVVESLSLYYHINCFRCSVCNVQLGNGTVGTDVRVRNNKLHCQNCYSNDEAGLKFSRV